MVYDVEPDKNDDPEAVQALPRRVRFYHAKIDGDSLKAGENYQRLKNVIVILISPYDPLGLNRMVYTIRSMCEEVPELPYDDGAGTIFLYTKGTEGNPPKELRQLLTYMEYTTKENAANDSLQNLNEMVEYVKRDKEVSLKYMKVAEWEEMLIRQGRNEEKSNTEKERMRADTEKERADTEKERADTEKERADTEKERADTEKERADAEKERADQAEAEVISEKKRADQAEAEVEYLKMQLAAMRSTQ